MSADSEGKVIGREEARGMGLTIYFSQKVCGHNHNGYRFVKTNTCVECKKLEKERKKVYGPRCSVEGCDRARDTKGFCPMHYARWKTHGDPLGGGTWNGDGLKWLSKNVGYQGQECLFWPFSEGGYPRVFIAGRSVGAHVEMCRMAHGNKSDDKDLAAHSCGNGHLGCLNPTHLRWATYAENCADRVIHGTQARGEASPNAKLTDDEAKVIRELKGSFPQRKIATMFGVSRGTVARIHRNKTWKHLA